MFKNFIFTKVPYLKHIMAINAVKLPLLLSIADQLRELSATDDSIQLGKEFELTGFIVVIDQISINVSGFIYLTNNNFTSRHGQLRLRYNTKHVLHTMVVGLMTTLFIMLLLV